MENMGDPYLLGPLVSTSLPSWRHPSWSKLSTKVQTSSLRLLPLGEWQPPLPVGGPHCWLFLVSVAKRSACYRWGRLFGHTGNEQHGKPQWPCNSRDLKSTPGTAVLTFRYLLAILLVLEQSPEHFEYREHCLCFSNTVLCFHPEKNDIRRLRKVPWKQSLASQSRI